MAERWTLVVGAAFAVLLMAASAGAQAIGVENAAAKPGKRLVLSPKHGKRVSAGPVGIRVRAEGKRKPFSAQLNGNSVGRHFSKPRHGVRNLKASLSHGLRHGRNRLHVRVGKSSDSTRFRVRRNRHLVGAGISRRLPTGGTVSLAGDHEVPGSRKRRRSARGDRAGATYHWKIVGPGSHGPSGGDTRGEVVDQLDRPDSRTPEFSPSLPGSHTLKLTVKTADGLTASDTVNVAADPTPAVPVDTMATGPNGSRGIQVGDAQHFYPANAGAWAQLVAVGRQDLAPVGASLGDLANKSYTCPESDTSACFNSLRSDLARLTSDHIAIVSNPCNGSRPLPAAGGSFEDALARIGVGRTGFTTDPSTVNFANCSISAIGVPGTDPGKGDWHAFRQPGPEPRTGAMGGYLIRNNEKNYTFESYDRVDFDTSVDNGHPGTASLMEIGNAHASEVWDEGSEFNGFHVVRLDPQTLRVVNTLPIPTATSDRERLVDRLAYMRDQLQHARGNGELVIVASVGVPAIQYYRSHSSPDDELNRLVSQVVDMVEQVGATRSAFYKMLDPALYGNNGYSYTLLGGGGTSPGHGEEVIRTGVAPTATGHPVTTARMTGTLARTGPNYTFELQSSPRVGPEPTGRDPSRGSAELTNIVLQRPTPWPEEGNAGRTAAIKWIGLKVFHTDDPRGQYWTVPFLKGAFDYGIWSDSAFAVQALKYSADDHAVAGTSFSEADLEWAKTELAGPLTNPPRVGGEIAWLQATHRYLDALATPWTNTALQNWGNFQDVANDVNKTVGASAEDKVAANATAVFDFVRDLLNETPVVGKGFKVANDVYDLALELVEINVGKAEQPAGEDFPSTVAEVGKDLTKRLQAAQGLLTRQLPNVIAADYGKLKAVGSCYTKDQANCPFNFIDWQYTQDDQADAETALLRGTQTWAHGELLPAKFSLYRLPPWWRTTVGDNRDFYSIDLGIGSAHLFPFRGLPSSAQLAKPIYRNMPTYAHTLSNHDGANYHNWTSTGETWQIYALGHVEPGRPPVMQFPDQSVTNKLFGPVNPTSPDGALGVDPETFFERSFTPATLDGWEDSHQPVGWCWEKFDPCPFRPGD